MLVNVATVIGEIIDPVDEDDTYNYPGGGGWADKIEHNVIKANVKFFFCLIPNYVVRAFRGVELWIHTFFTWTVGEDK